MTFRETLEAEIKKQRPNLNPSSVKTYTSILFNLRKKLEPDNDDIKFFDNDEKIIDSLKDKTPQTRKTVLAALFILTNNKAYNELMLSDCKHTNDLYKTQKKTKKEEDGWVSVEQIKEIYDDFFEKVNAMFSKKLLADYQIINNFIFTSFNLS